MKAAMDGYTLQELGPRDAASFRAVRLQALSEAPEAFGTSVFEERKKTVRTYQRELGQGKKYPGEFLLGVFSEDASPELLAVLGFYRHQKAKTMHKGLFWGMFVAESARRRGLGRWLLAEALERVRLISAVEVLQISVVTSNEPAIKLYESFGFETYGREDKAFKLGNCYHDVFHLSYNLRMQATTGLSCKEA